VSQFEPFHCLGRLDFRRASACFSLNSVAASPLPRVEAILDAAGLIDTFPLHVLVVDHDSKTLELVSKRLTAEGHQVTTRATAIGTRADIVSLRPDLVILDVTMPGLRGDDLTVLLGLYPATADIAVILHCPEGKDVRRQTGALGVIRKTDDDAAFMRQFRRLAEKLFDGALPSAAATRKFSGTHRVASKVEVTVPSLDLTRTAASGSTKAR
jgi:CheY-like chemotaxis protein